MLHQYAAFLQFQADRNTGLMFFLQFMAKTGEAINPGFDEKHVATLILNRERSAPGVIAHKLHGRRVPRLRTGHAPGQGHGQLIMAVSEHLAGHRHLLPHRRLGGKLAAIEHR